MHNISKDNIFYFEKFKKIPWLTHGFSTRKFGNLKLEKEKTSFKITHNLKLFTDKLNIPIDNLVIMDQVHSNSVEFVNKKYIGKYIKKTDALITNGKNIFLGVNTADCVPIFFVEKDKKIVAIAHAGWKGTQKNIVTNVIKKMVKEKADINKIIIGIGPCIGKCCYRVPEKRFNLIKSKFKAIFGNIKNNSSYCLDLGAINVKILTKLGIKSKNIDAPFICTSCNNNLFFSYRKKNNDVNYGEMLGVIGINS